MQQLKDTKRFQELQELSLPNKIQIHIDGKVFPIVAERLEGLLTDLLADNGFSGKIHSLITGNSVKFTKVE